MNLNDINTEFDSYQQLITLYNHCKCAILEEINIDVTGWFAGNLCSPLGAVLDKLRSDGSNRIIVNIKGKSKEIIQF
jgi:hypothetical protein